MTEHDTQGTMDDFECLDPVLGDQIQRLDDADTSAELRARLEHHVVHCAACRLQRAVDRELAAGLRDGALTLPAPRPRRTRAAAWTVCCGTTALAAGFAVLLLLPPRAALDGMVVRGGDEPTISRPVADEVVRGGRPTLRWTPLEGATSYEVRVTAVDGDYAWTTSTDEPRVTVPDDAPLPVGRRFRARVAPVPPHLAPDGALRTSFRTGGPRAWFAYRLRHGPTAGRWLAGAGALGILAGLAALMGRRFPR